MTRSAAIRRPRWRAAALLGAVVAALAGCASMGGGAAASPVDGWRLQIAVKYPSQQRYELFRITREGQVQYGGGMNAFNDVTTWETALSPDQATQFVDLMNACPWVAQAPTERGDGKSEPMLVVKFAHTGMTERNFTLYGRNDEAEKLVAFMRGCTQQRYQGVLQKLPESTEKSAKPPTAPAAQTSGASTAPAAQAPAAPPAAAPRR
jgi:hypothetical protein